MSRKKDEIISQYSLGREEKRATFSRSSSLEFHYTKKHLSGLITKNSRIIEVGCATGYYGLYYSDKCKEYVGIDIVPAHIKLFNQKILDNKLENVSCFVGDATNLEYADNSFDVVLCLGPMYHLSQNERESAFSECARICKEGGILAFAYINKIGVYVGACVYDDENYRKTYPNKKANKFILSEGTDDLKPDTFFFTTPEEMEETSKRFGLTKIKNLATDFFITMSIVNNMTDEQFDIMRPLYDQMTNYESCTGMSNHALLICAKQVK